MTGGHLPATHLPPQLPHQSNHVAMSRVCCHTLMTHHLLSCPVCDATQARLTAISWPKATDVMTTEPHRTPLSSAGPHAQPRTLHGWDMEICAFSTQVRVQIQTKLTWRVRLQPPGQLAAHPQGPACLTALMPAGGHMTPSRQSNDCVTASAAVS